MTTEEAKTIESIVGLFEQFGIPLRTDMLATRTNMNSEETMRTLEARLLRSTGLRLELLDCGIKITGPYYSSSGNEYIVTITRPVTYYNNTYGSTVERVINVTGSIRTVIIQVAAEVFEFGCGATLESIFEAFKEAKQRKIDHTVLNALTQGSRRLTSEDVR